MRLLQDKKDFRNVLKMFSEQIWEIGYVIGYTKPDFRLKPGRITFRALWNVARALVESNGMRLYGYKLAWRTNAVLSGSSSSAGICQYPPLPSIVLKLLPYLNHQCIPRVTVRDTYLLPRIEVRGNRYVSLTAIFFRWRYSMQNLKDPSHFGPRKICEANSRVAGSITSKFDFFWSSNYLSSQNLAPARWGAERHERLFSLSTIRCLAVLMHPSFLLHISSRKSSILLILSCCYTSTSGDDISRISFWILWQFSNSFFEVFHDTQHFSSHLRRGHRELWNSLCHFLYLVFENRLVFSGNSYDDNLK